jgi:ATP synthase protein I
MVDRPTDATPDGTGPVSTKVDEAHLARRLERLGESLEAHRAADETANRGGKPSGFAQATKVASEFVAGVIVGGGLGWGIDKAAGTSPWALIVFLLLGFAAGVLNVLRVEGVVADAGARLREVPPDETSRPDR